MNRFSNFFTTNNSPNVFRENLLDKSLNEPEMAGFLLGDETPTLDENINIITKNRRGRVRTLEIGKQIADKLERRVDDVGVLQAIVGPDAITRGTIDTLNRRINRATRNHPDLIEGIQSGLEKQKNLKSSIQDSATTDATIRKKEKKKKKNKKK